MKRYIFKTILCSALTLSLTTSCELDQYPEDQIPAEQSWQNFKDAQKYHIGMLASLRGAVTNTTFTCTDAMADLFNAMFGGTSYLQEHQWRFTTTQFAGDAIWDGNYGMISIANDIINHIDQIPAADKDQKTALQNFKGTALFARALGYSNMIVRYCENYDEATADSNLGLPLVTNVDVNAKPKRATLKESYNFIMQDVDKAIELLSDTEDYTVPCKTAAVALKARVSLYMKNYDEAISAAQKVIEKYPLTEAADYETLWTDDEGTEIIFQPYMDVKERTGSVEGVYVSFNKGSNTYSPSYIPTQGLMDLYEKEDVRKQVYFTKREISAKDLIDNGYMFTKFPGNPALRESSENETNSWYNMCKVFRTSEMYLIAAEASLSKTNRDEQAALKFLNTLRSKRNASELNTSGKELTKDMKNEWTREMVGEGVRLNNLKRWGEGVKRMTPQTFSKNMLVNTPPTEYTELNIQPNDPLYFKMIWELPANDLQSNGNLVPNWK